MTFFFFIGFCGKISTVLYHGFLTPNILPPTSFFGAHPEWFMTGKILCCFIGHLPRFSRHLEADLARTTTSNVAGTLLWSAHSVTWRDLKGDSVGAQDPPVTIGFDTKSWSNDLDKFGAHDLGNLHMTIKMFHFMNYSRGASNGLDMFGP
jgi:hypothetical protein